VALSEQTAPVTVATATPFLQWTPVVAGAFVASAVSLILMKVLRNTNDARRQAAKLCYRFGPLIPSARSANLTARDGT
jgi:hypothetical protein